MDDMVIILPPGEPQPVQLSGTGAALWDVLAEPVGLDHAATLLAEEYNADVDRVAADLVPIFEDLSRLGIIQAVEGH